MDRRSGLKFWQQRDRITRKMKLPSCGWLYGDLLPGGEVTVSAIRGENEEVLAGAGEGRAAMPVMRDILEQLTSTGRLPYNQLLFSDWNALMLNFFAFSYGATMQLKVKCPHCKEFPAEPYLIDVANLPCKVYDEMPAFVQDADTLPVEQRDSAVLIREPFASPPLPPYGDVVHFRLLRVEDMIATENYFRKGNKMGKQGDFVRTYALAKHIVAIGAKGGHQVEEVTLMEAMDYVRLGAPGETLVALRNAITNVEPGYDMVANLICPRSSCGAEFQIRIPEDGSFFRTSAAQHRKLAETTLLDDES